MTIELIQRPRRGLVTETPVALVCNAVSLGVMMASPQDLEDFATGFALSEGLVGAVDDIREVEIQRHDMGIELRLWLTASQAPTGARRRVSMAAVGCGLCGIESLEQAARALPRLPDRRAQLTRAEIRDAPVALRRHQPEHDRTGASHAAGFYVPEQGLVAVREDVGRHNALDKLIGALLRRGMDPASGAVVMTSRISTELVQKCATVGLPTLLSVSAPTDLAVAMARTANMTLVTNIRDGQPFGEDLWSSVD